MKMKKIAGLLFLFFAYPVILLGQTVGTRNYDGRNYDYIDCSDMPAGMVTMVKKSLTTNATNTNSPAPSAGLNDLATEESNAQLYVKFEIWYELSPRYRWREAFNYCRGLSGGGWRMPTAREMCLIFMLRDQLTNVLSNNGTYHSATDIGSRSVLTLTSNRTSFQGGNLQGLSFLLGDFTIESVGNKENGNYVRCVRDMDYP